jgi:hypothetical protein
MHVPPHRDHEYKKDQPWERSNKVGDFVDKVTRYLALEVHWVLGVVGRKEYTCKK